MSDTTHATAQIAIEDRLRIQWADDDVDLRYENDPRKKPLKSYVHLFVRSGRAVEMGFSSSRVLYRRPGWIVAQCFVEAKTGTQVCRAIADAVIAIYEGQTFSEIIFREGEVVEVGDEGNGFWQLNAKVYFDFDFERTIT